MKINGVYMNALTAYEEKKGKNIYISYKGFSETWCQNKTEQEQKKKHLEKKENVCEELSPKAKDTEKEDEQTTTKIIVKADGSRVLLVNVKVAGMEMTTSLKISDATDMDNSSYTEMESFSGSNLELSEDLEQGTGNCSL